jgi:thymidylate synthase
MIVGETFQEAYYKTMKEVKENGKKVVARGMETKEIHPCLVQVNNPLKRVLLYPKRGNNPFQALAESMWVIAGRRDVKWLEKYLPRVKEFSDDGITWRCLTGDNKIRLLNGKNRTIKKIYKVFKGRKENQYVYTWTNGGWEVSKIINAIKSKRVDKIVEIVLDNGNIVKTTLDHKIMLRDSSYKEAQDLKVNDSLMPFYVNDSLKMNRKDYGYKKYDFVLDNNTKIWELSHKISFKHLNEATKECIHHKDLNSANNNPENLVSLTNIEHRKIHAKIAQKIHKNKMDNDEVYRKKFIKQSINNLNCANKLFHEKFGKDNEYTKKYIEVRSNNCKNLNSREDVKILQMYGRIRKVLDSIIGEITREKYELTRKNRAGAPSIKTIELKYGAFEDIVDKILLKNHKVKSICIKNIKSEWVYDIEVDNDSHNFALSSGIVVHNSGYGPRIRAHEGIRDIVGAIDKNSCDCQFITVTDQLAYIVKTLKDDLYSRRAVLTIWDPAKENTIGDSVDYPCNDLLQFLYRDNKLDLMVYVRSNDVIWGFGSVNFYEWSILLEIVSSCLNVDVGKIHYLANSMHVYERHYDKLEKLINSYEILEDYPIFRICKNVNYDFIEKIEGLCYDLENDFYLSDKNVNDNLWQVTRFLHAYDKYISYIKYNDKSVGDRIFLSGAYEKLMTLEYTDMLIACVWWMMKKEFNPNISVKEAIAYIDLRKD